jgi:hypothetical protein
VSNEPGCIIDLVDCRRKRYKSFAPRLEDTAERRCLAFLILIMGRPLQARYPRRCIQMELGNHVVASFTRLSEIFGQPVYTHSRIFMVKLVKLPTSLCWELV